MNLRKNPAPDIFLPGRNQDFVLRQNNKGIYLQGENGANVILQHKELRNTALKLYSKGCSEILELDLQNELAYFQKSAILGQFSFTLS